ncbi:MAG: hypothetical protein LBL46_02115 [Rickettsiales bacterium]|jgi:hypothetical protein|nr:hypothetical protein [Rickettsiales bacterium]
MTKIKMTIPSPDGQPKQVEVEGDIIDVRSPNEQWSEYIMENGDTLRVKPILVRAVRFPFKAPNGDPAYSLETTTVVSVVEGNNGPK